MSLGEPVVAMLIDELVVIQVRICGVDPINLFTLTRRQRFLRIKTLDAAEESLAAQYLVEAGDTAGEPMGGIEERGIGIGHLSRLNQQFGR